MFGKLFKRDFRWTMLPLYVYYPIIIALAIIGKLAANWQSPFGSIMRHLVAGALPASVIGTIITCALRNIGRYHRNIFKDEAYLTHTLPVKKSLIYNAKIASALATLLITSTVILLAIRIYFDAEYIQILLDALKTNSTALFVVAGVLMLTLQYFCIYLSGVLGCHLGNRSKGKRTVMSVVFAVAIYFATQAVLMTLLYLSRNIFPAVDGMFGNGSFAPTEGDIAGIMLGIASLYFAVDLAYYLVGQRMLGKGVDLE